MKRLETDSSFEVLIIASPNNFATEIILIFLDPAPTVSLKIVSLTTRFFRSELLILSTASPDRTP